MEYWGRVLLGWRWGLLALFAGVLAPLLVFGALAKTVWEREGFAWDAPILRDIHAHASPQADAVMIFVSRYGNGTGLVPLCAAVALALLARHHQLRALFVVLGYGGAEALDAIAKAVFRSPRPHLWVSPYPAGGYGFPSGHAMGSMALFAACSLLAWHTRWRWPVLAISIALVGLISFSRLYLGVHYPSDVLGAWTGALAWVVGLYLLLSRRLRPRSSLTRGSRSLVACPALPCTPARRPTASSSGTRTGTVAHHRVSDGCRKAAPVQPASRMRCEIPSSTQRMN